MEDMKLWYQSKTVWGALVAILASLLQTCGYYLDANGQVQLVNDLFAISAALGGLVALYGRMSADKRLG